MEELLSTIKHASEKLIKEYNVESIDIYVDEDVSENKRVRVSIDF